MMRVSSSDKSQVLRGVSSKHVFAFCRFKGGAAKAAWLDALRSELTGSIPPFEQQLFSCLSILGRCNVAAKICAQSTGFLSGRV
jgi:hypothetical protein